MIARDLCTGWGGWLDGLVLEGFDDVHGYDVDARILEGNPHPTTCIDVYDLPAHELEGADLITASPPCRDFSKLAMGLGQKWRVKPDPGGRGLDLVKRCLKIIRDAEPRYWILENVVGLIPYLGEKPRFKAWVSPTMYRAFWGNFPAFLVPRDMRKGRMTVRFNWDGLGSARNSKIPLAFSRAVGKAVRDAVTSSPD